MLEAVVTLLIVVDEFGNDWMLGNQNISKTPVIPVFQNYGRMPPMY